MKKRLTALVKFSIIAALRLVRSFCPFWREDGKLGQRRMGDPRVRKRKSYRRRRQFITMTVIVENFPNGFPRLSCFLDSDDAFMVYRRFGTVFSRLLLSKQDELSRMEMELNGMDKNDEANGDENYLMSNTLDADRPSIPTTWPQSRPELLAKMEKTAVEYGKSMTTLTPAFKTMKLILPLKAELLLKAQQLKALEPPSRRDYKSVLHFMENDGGPLFEEEAGFIYEKEDLVTLRPGREHAWLDNVLERILQKCRCGLLLVSTV